MDTVCAVVVTYNRKKLLLECLEALRKQTRPVQGIYLIDNASTDGTPKLLLEKGYIKELPPENLTEPWEKEFEIRNLTDGEIIKLHYVRMHENTGGAGGFHEGVKRAYEKGYDWLWLMDDDVEPISNTLENMFIKKMDFSVKVPLRIYKEDNSFVKSESIEMNYCNPFLPHKINFISQKHLRENLEYIEISNFPFEGVLIYRKIISKVGFPDKSYFVIADDTDYAIRIKKAGFKIYLIKNSIMYRKIKPSLSKNLTLKSYYYIRNIIILDRKYGNVMVKYIRPIFFFLRFLLSSILKMRNIDSFKLLFKAFKDGYFYK